jgi:hypothetical protein
MAAVAAAAALIAAAGTAAADTADRLLNAESEFGTASIPVLPEGTPRAEAAALQAILTKRESSDASFGNRRASWRRKR